MFLTTKSRSDSNWLFVEQLRLNEDVNELLMAFKLRAYFFSSFFGSNFNDAELMQ